MNREVHVRFSEGLALKYAGLLDTAIPELLATLALEGCAVTIDAMGTRQTSRGRSGEGGADYVLCVKDNHPKLVDAIVLAQAGVGHFDAEFPERDLRQRPRAHRKRRCWAFDAVNRLYKAEQWLDLKSFAIVERERTVGIKTSRERRYYISSPAGGRQAHCSCGAQPLGSGEPTPLVPRRAVQRRPVHCAHRLRRQQPCHRPTHRDERPSPQHPRKGSIKTKRMLAATSDQFAPNCSGL